MISVAAIGFTAGVMSGLLGVGGGVVMVPLLVAFAGLRQHQAHATSLAAIIAIGAFGAIPFALEDNISWSIAALLALGTLVGAPVGARAMAQMSEARLKIAFGILMVLIAARMLWN